MAWQTKSTTARSGTGNAETDGCSPYLPARSSGDAACGRAPHVETNYYEHAASRSTSAPLTEAGLTLSPQPSMTLPARQRALAITMGPARRDPRLDVTRCPSDRSRKSACRLAPRAWPRSSASPSMTLTSGRTGFSARYSLCGRRRHKRRCAGCPGGYGLFTGGPLAHTTATPPPSPLAQR